MIAKSASTTLGLISKEWCTLCTLCWSCTLLLVYMLWMILTNHGKFWEEGLGWRKRESYLLNDRKDLYLVHCGKDSN